MFGKKWDMHWRAFNSNNPQRIFACQMEGAGGGARGGQELHDGHRARKEASRERVNRTEWRVCGHVGCIEGPILITPHQEGEYEQRGNL